jgi:hypothetical protein
LGLGRKIGLAAVATIVAGHVPGLACELKHSPRSEATGAADRKPAKWADAERARPERSDAIYDAPMPSRRIILQ